MQKRTFCNASYLVWKPVIPGFQKARDCSLQWSTWILIKFLSCTLPWWNLMLLMGGDLMNSIIFCTVLASAVVIAVSNTISLKSCKFLRWKLACFRCLPRDFIKKFQVQKNVLCHFNIALGYNVGSVFGHIGINTTAVTFVSISSSRKPVILCSIFLLMTVVERKGNSKNH